MSNTMRIGHPVSKIDKQIYQFTISLINLLQRARKNNKNMQNKANFKSNQICKSTCETSGYGNFRLILRPKNKAKQSQNKANFGPKLALFSQNWLYENGGAYQNITEKHLCDLGIFVMFWQNWRLQYNRLKKFLRK